MLKQGSGSSGGFTVLGKGSIPWTQPRNVFVIVRFTEYFWWMKCIRCIPDSSCYAINDGREFVNPSADEQWHGDKCLFSPRLAEAWEFPTEHTCQSTIFVVVWKHPPWLLSNKIRSVRSRWLDCRDIYEIRAAIPFFDSERALVPLLFNACWCLDSILWHWIVPPYLEIYTTHKSKVLSILSHSQIRSINFHWINYEYTQQ